MIVLYYSSIDAYSTDLHYIKTYEVKPEMGNSVEAVWNYCYGQDHSRKAVLKLFVVDVLTGTITLAKEHYNEVKKKIVINRLKEPQKPAITTIGNIQDIVSYWNTLPQTHGVTFDDLENINP